MMPLNQYVKRAVELDETTIANLYKAKHLCLGRGGKSDFNGCLDLLSLKKRKTNNKRVNDNDFRERVKVLFEIFVNGSFSEQEQAKLSAFLTTKLDLSYYAFEATKLYSGTYECFGRKKNRIKSTNILIANKEQCFGLAFKIQPDDKGKLENYLFNYFYVWTRQIEGLPEEQMIMGI